MSILTRSDVQARIREARDNNRHIDLSGQDLCDLDLSHLDLRGADLRCANLRVTDLQGADLRSADLRSADLWGARLWDVDLQDANLRGADLQNAGLQDANLRGVNLRNVRLWDATWGGLSIDNLPSGCLALIPTPDGWHMQVGCWGGAPDQLRHLIAQDEDWPEAEGKEITRRRPYLEAALALCEAHMADHTDVIDELHAQWGSDEDAAA